MATQSTTSIPLSSSHTPQAFKLLELPPELLALLESEKPPTLTITTSPSTGHALLNLHSSTATAQQYQIRQKNTSNPLLLLQPSRTGPTQAQADGATEAAPFVSQPSVTIVARIEDTLELIRQESVGEKKREVKVNKWHEKFARSREAKK